MGNADATVVVRTVRPNRHGLVALLGLGAIGVGFLVPANATPPDDDGVHKSYVCKYVGKPGEGELLQTGQNPIWVDNASIMASTGKDSVDVGDTFVDGQFSSVVIVANSPKLNPEPGIDECPGGTTPTETTTTTPTGTTTTTPTETTTTTPTETTTTTPTETTTTTGGGQTGGGATGGGATGGGATGGGQTGGGATGAGAAGNAVPLAATDGADLDPGTGLAAVLRSLFFGSGILMLGGGLLGLRRKAQA